MQPIQLALGLFLLLTCGFSGSSPAQENQIVHVGVAVLQNTGGVMLGTEARDRLVKALNHEKPDKKLHLSMQAVPLEVSAGEQAVAEAKQKNCDYVLYANVTEMEAESHIEGKAGYGTNVPAFNAAVEYKLQRVSDGSDATSGSAKALDFGSQAQVLSQALDHVASKVFGYSKKAASPAQK